MPASWLRRRQADSPSGVPMVAAAHRSDEHQRPSGRRRQGGAWLHAAIWRRAGCPPFAVGWPEG